MPRCRATRRISYIFLCIFFCRQTSLYLSEHNQKLKPNLHSPLYWNDIAKPTLINMQKYTTVDRFGNHRHQRQTRKRFHEFHEHFVFLSSDDFFRLVWSSNSNVFQSGRSITGKCRPFPTKHARNQRSMQPPALLSVQSISDTCPSLYRRCNSSD